MQEKGHKQQYIAKLLYIAVDVVKLLHDLS
jgi:hypothetical protein